MAEVEMCSRQKKKWTNYKFNGLLAFLCNLLFRKKPFTYILIYIKPKGKKRAEKQFPDVLYKTFVENFSSWKVKATLQTKQPRRQLATSRTPTYPCFAWTVKQLGLRTGEQRSKASKSWLWSLLSFWECQKKLRKPRFSNILPQEGLIKILQSILLLHWRHFLSHTLHGIWEGKANLKFAANWIIVACEIEKSWTCTPFRLFGSPSLSKYRLNFVSAPLAIFTAVSPQRCWAANHWGCISNGTLARYSPTLGNIHLGKLANIKLPSLQLDRQLLIHLRGPNHHWVTLQQ